MWAVEVTWYLVRNFGKNCRSFQHIWWKFSQRNLVQRRAVVVVTHSWCDKQHLFSNKHTGESHKLMLKMESECLLFKLCGITRWVILSMQKFFSKFLQKIIADHFKTKPFFCTTLSGSIYGRFELCWQWPVCWCRTTLLIWVNWSRQCGRQWRCRWHWSQQMSSVCTHYGGPRLSFDVH